MINMFEVNETNKMITQENLDVRTITLGISLLDCVDADLDRLNENIYRKITTLAANLVKTGQEIEREYGLSLIHISSCSTVIKETVILHILLGFTKMFRRMKRNRRW